MNPESESNQRTNELRNDIDQTRQHMDQTIDSLADRFQGRHLMDEVVGFFRSNTSAATQRAGELKDRLSESANAAAKSVSETVKAHPVPVALIGAGVAWIIYNGVRQTRPEKRTYSPSPYENEIADESGYELTGGGYSARDVANYAGTPKNTYGFENDTPAGKLQALKSQAQEKLDYVKGRLNSAAAEVGDQVSRRTQAVRDKAEELSSRVQEGTRRVYTRSRDQVVDTVQHRPVEVGLGLLFLGVVVGLALPTPDKVNEVVGPRADRLRQRAREAGRDLANRGRHVVHAAVDAVKHEAETQGLTPSALKGKVEAVGRSGVDAARASAQDEEHMASSDAPAPRNESV